MAPDRFLGLPAWARLAVFATNCVTAGGAAVVALAGATSWWWVAPPAVGAALGWGRLVARPRARGVAVAVGVDGPWVVLTAVRAGAGTLGPDEARDVADSLYSAAREASFARARPPFSHN